MTVDGETDLQLSGDVVKVDLTLRPGDAEQAGITVFGDDSSGTRIGYDTTTGRVFVDRRDSGMSTSTRPSPRSKTPRSPSSTAR